MVSKKTKSSPRESDRGINERASNKQLNFDKASGSSRNDKEDLRDVARKAAKKSQ
jgi:hypothetical protein